MIKLEFIALFHVGVVELGEAEFGLSPSPVLLFDHRPTQPPSLDVLFVGRQVLMLKPSESAILFKEMLVDIDIVVEDNNDLFDLMIPKMAIQPLVENSIIHGLYHRICHIFNVIYAKINFSSNG